MTEYLSINKVALLLDISTATIKRWYLWWDNTEFEKPDGLYLPHYYFMDRRKTKFFKESDIPHLKKFHEDINGKYKGAMSEFNAVYSWGKPGKKILGDRYKKIQKKVRG